MCNCNALEKRNLIALLVPDRIGVSSGVFLFKEPLQKYWEQQAELQKAQEGIPKKAD